MKPDEARGTFESVVASVSSVLFGKEEVIRLALYCLVADGHLLLEDLPGVGKTTLAKALARSLGLSFRRVQFTADLLPSDLLGAMYYERDSGHMTFRPGPVFTNLLLADELNRASPRAQSALLETMEECQVSVDGTTHPLPRPFMVIATQNPFDAAGTYPLPHSQRDRFLMRISIGYPALDAEVEMLERGGDSSRADELDPACKPGVLDELREEVASAHVSQAVRDYILAIVAATRRHPDLSVGASPRAALAVLRAARAASVCAGRPFVAPDDVKEVAVAALSHRVLPTSAAELSGITGRSVVASILGEVPVPVVQHA